MVAFILPANSVTGGYEIDNSLRFNDNDSPNLSITPSSAGNRAVWTWSAWVKISNIKSGSAPLFTAGDWTGGSTATGAIFYNSQIYTYWNSPSGGTSTTAKFRDPSAWYHIVLQANTSTLKVYVNSVEQSSKSISGNGEINNTSAQVIGKYANTTTDYFDGYMSEINFVDGSALAPTEFGETNDNGVWIPKAYSGTYGNNGFFLEFKQTGTSQNSSGMGADTSGNDNHFAVTNLAATDVTTDTPTNNFATLNPVAVTNSDSVLTEGNTVHTVTNGNAWIGAYTTLGAASGKWYAEVKILDVDNNSFGVIQSGGDTVANINTDNSGYIGKYADGWGWWGNGNATQILNNNSNTDYGVAESVNDIYMIAVDIDGGKIWVGKNGTWFNAPGTTNVGDPANGNNPGVSSISFTDFVHFATGNEAADNDDAAVGWNFGNAAHSISSGNADANGYGNFEYAVPSGFYSLCTKNLAEFG